MWCDSLVVRGGPDRRCPVDRISVVVGNPARGRGQRTSPAHWPSSWRPAPGRASPDDRARRSDAVVVRLHRRRCATSGQEDPVELAGRLREPTLKASLIGLSSAMSRLPQPALRNERARVVDVVMFDITTGCSPGQVLRPRGPLPLTQPPVDGVQLRLCPGPPRGRDAPGPTDRRTSSRVRKSEAPLDLVLTDSAPLIRITNRRTADVPLIRSLPTLQRLPPTTRRAPEHA